MADHARSWGSALSLTDPEHVTAAAKLRHAFQTPQTPAASTRTDDSHVRDLAEASDVGVRDLADYDTAFGVTIETPIETAIDAGIEVAS